MTKSLDERLSDGLEMVRCAQANLRNLVREAPHVSATTAYRIVVLQLEQAEDALLGKENE